MVCALVRGGENGGYDADYATEAKRQLDEANGTGIRLRWLVVDGNDVVLRHDGAELGAYYCGSKTVAKGHTVLNFSF